MNQDTLLFWDFSCELAYLLPETKRTKDIVFLGGKKTLLSLGLWKQKQCSFPLPFQGQHMERKTRIPDKHNSRFQQLNSNVAHAAGVKTGEQLKTGQQCTLYRHEDAISIFKTLGPACELNREACLQSCSK